MSDQQPVLEPVQATPPAMPAPKRKSNRTANIMLGLAGIIAIGGLAFAAGRFTAPALAVTPGGGNGGFGNFPGPGGSFDLGQFPGGGQGGPGGGGFGGAFGGGTLSGQVTAITGSAITLQLANGGTLEIPIDEATEYQAATQASASEVVVGSNVLIQSTDVTFIPGSGPGATFDPTTGQPQASFGPAEQVIVLDE